MNSPDAAERVRWSSCPTAPTLPHSPPPHWAARSAPIANSLLFDAEGEPVLILTSGAHRVDTAAVAERIGVGSLTRASPDFVRRHTGQVIGGVSPIDHPAPIRTWIDPWLRRHEVVWAAAGHPASVFSTTYDELLAMTDAVEVQVDQDPEDDPWTRCH